MTLVPKIKPVLKTKTVSKKSQDSRELVEIIEILKGKDECGFRFMCLDTVEIYVQIC